LAARRDDGGGKRVMCLPPRFRQGRSCSELQKRKNLGAERCAFNLWMAFLSNPPLASRFAKCKIAAGRQRCALQVAT
jgi:hypothetical protein